MSTLLDSIRCVARKKRSFRNIVQTGSGLHLPTANTWKIYADSKKLRDESLATCVLDHFLLILVINVLSYLLPYLPRTPFIGSAITEESFKKNIGS